MKVIYNHRRLVEGLIREPGIATDVSDRAGMEHIAEGICKAVKEAEPEKPAAKEKKFKGDEK